MPPADLTPPRGTPADITYPCTPSPTAPAAAPRKKSHFLSGGASGLLSAILLQPADLLKTRLQQAPPSKSATHTLVSTLKTIATGPRPIRTLWRGTLPSALRTGLGSALYFSSLHTLRSALLPAAPPTPAPRSSSLPQLPALANLAAGALTRALVGFAMMPVTILKVRYESSLYAYTSLWAATRDIYRCEGLRGFFSGWGATAIRDAPFAGLYVLFYEQCKVELGRVLLRGEDAAEKVLLVNTVSGGLAAAAATAVTNPFDAVKTRIQVDPMRYRNMWEAAKVVWGEERGGWKGRGFLDGLGLRMARKAVSSALVWGLYEGLVREGR